MRADGVGPAAFRLVRRQPGLRLGLPQRRIQLLRQTRPVQRLRSGIGHLEGSDVPLRIICNEGKTAQLLGQLATHQLDVVVTDAPLGSDTSVRAFNHLLGESGVTIFGTAAHVRSVRRRFPQSLTGAPLLLPTEGTTLRRALDQWFAAREVRPAVVAEFEDGALLKVFGQSGLGLFPGPTVLEREIRRQYGVVAAGRLPDVRERFYAISVERRLKHPAVVAISEAARTTLET